MNTTRNLFLAALLASGLGTTSAYADGDDNVVDTVVDVIVNDGNPASIIFTPSETAPPSVDECQGMNCTDQSPPEAGGGDEDHSGNIG